MPQKRKAVIDLSGDSDGEVMGHCSPSKTVKSAVNMSPDSESGNSATSPAGIEDRRFKYSNADTVSEGQTCYAVAWNLTWNRRGYRLGKSINTNQEFRSELERAGLVSTSGFLVSKRGVELSERLLKKKEKKESEVGDDDDSAGRGVSELVLGQLRGFDRDIFKPAISPYKKWAYVEGLATFLKLGNLMTWAMCDDSFRIGEIVEEFGLMILTSLEMLSEHNLLAPDSPVKNIPVILLILLAFVLEWEGLGYDIGWPCEVVRVCDEAGIDLAQPIQYANNMIQVKDENIQAWRSEYMKKQTSSGFAKHAPFNGNGYMYWASKEHWMPKHDGPNLYEKLYLSRAKRGFSPVDYLKLSDPMNHGGENEKNEERKKWFRWDWKLEHPAFKAMFSGGARRAYYVVRET